MASVTRDLDVDPRRARVIRDPVHDYIQMPIELNELVDHPFVQRLRRISQTSMSSSVFPSMTGSRFEHSLGAMHLAQTAWQSLWLRLPGPTRDSFVEDVHVDLSRRSKTFHDDARTSLWVGDASRFRSEFAETIGLALGATALLHDLGHPPFSHALEAFYERNLDLVLSEMHGPTDELAQRIRDTWADPFHEKVGARLLLQIDNRAFEGVPRYLVGRILNATSGDGWDKALHDIVASEVDVDRIDYLIRDARRSGTEFGSVDKQRLIDSLELHEIRAAVAGQRLWKVGYGYRARTAIETLLTNRLRYYQWVLFHPHVAAANKFLDLALQELVDLSALSQTIEPSDADLAVTEAFENLRPDLNYFDARPPVGRRDTVAQQRGVRLRLSDPDPVNRQAEVDDSTIIQWLKSSASLARAALDNGEITSGLRTRIGRFLGLYSATLFRLPNWAPVWKTEDQYAQIAAQVANPLAEVLKSNLSDLMEGASAAVSSREAIVPTTAAVSDLLRALIEDGPVEGMNAIARALLVSRQPSVRLRRERQLTDAFARNARRIPGLEAGTWIFAYDRVAATKEDGNDLHVWQLNNYVPLKEISSMVDLLPQIAKSYPQMFAYFLAPTELMRSNRVSHHSADLRDIFVETFPRVVDELLRKQLMVGEANGKRD
jgi:HD superfamily phosphohydrolase